MKNIQLPIAIVAFVFSTCFKMWCAETTADKTYIAPADSSAKNIELKEIAITGRRSASTRRVISQTPVYNRADMSVAPISTLESAMKLSPAIDVRERGGRGVQTDLLVRGGSFDQTMVLLNGVNFTDARTGHQSHSLPIDLNVVSSVSVVDGVAGVGAYSGAVNIQTSAMSERNLTAEASGGMHGYGYGNLYGNFNVKDCVDVMAMASIRHSDGYRHNTAFTNYNAYANSRFYTSRSGTFEVQAGYQHRAFGANGFYARTYPDQYETTTTGLSSVKWHYTHRRLTLTALGSYRRNTDCYELIRGDESLVPFNHHITNNFGAAVGAAYDWYNAGETSVDVDFAANNILSTVLGDECRPIKKGDVVYTHSKHRRTVNALLRHTFTLRTLSLSAAAGVANTPYGTDWLWSVGASVGLTEMWRVGAGAVRSMRLPTFTDLYYTAKGYESDRNLTPEHAVTFNLSSNFNNGPWSASAYTYYRRGSNVIDWIKLAGAENWRSMQVTRVNTAGVELTGAYSQASSLLRRVSVSYGYIYQDTRAEAGMTSAYVLDYMRNKLAISLDIVPFNRLILSFVGTLFDRAGNYSSGAGEVKAYHPFFTLDGRVTYIHTHWQVYADCTNLTATRYFDFGGLEMPRAWLTAGVIVRI